VIALRDVLPWLLAALVTAGPTARMAPHAEIAVERYANGQVRREATYRGGVLDGVVRGWYESGAREYERTYRGGLEVGEHRGWYDSGALKFVYHFRNGMSDGEQRQWYPGGQPFALFHHALGHEVGQQQLWNADGTIRSNYVIRDGRRFGLLGAMGCTGRGPAERGAIQ
jgi:antitoxin component YwqK of YwqJK toxin-antitoxin module